MTTSIRFLALYFSSRVDDGEEHLARRIGDGEVHPALHHLEHSTTARLGASASAAKPTT